MPILKLIFKDYQISASYDNIGKQKHHTHTHIQITASVHTHNADFLMSWLTGKQIYINLCILA